MRKRRYNGWADMMGVLLGVLAALLAAAAGAAVTWLVDRCTGWSHADTSIGAGPLLLLFPAASLCLTPCSSFLVTLLIPRSSDWCAPTGHMALWAYATILVGGAEDAGPVVLPAGLAFAGIMWAVSYLGVRFARRHGRRERWYGSATPGDPRCPRCGYVLYHAANQRCPECGRSFSLTEVDTRRARWDGSVLRPEESFQSSLPGLNDKRRKNV